MNAICDPSGEICGSATQTNLNRSFSVIVRRCAASGCAAAQKSSTRTNELVRLRMSELSLFVRCGCILQQLLRLRFDLAIDGRVPSGPRVTDDTLVVEEQVGGIDVDAECALYGT